MSSMHSRRFLLTVFSLILGVASARALEWEKTEIVTTPERGAEVVRARFEFKNTAKQRVRVLEVRTSCGCTEATPTASEFAPGESGTLWVLFTIGTRTGPQEKEIVVLSDDTKVPTRLVLKVNLPPPPKPA